jgi:hypothetical protein
MCDEHLAAFHELQDKEVACRNPGCDNTWTWKRGTQLHMIQRQEKLKTPRRLCESCAGEEKNITDAQVECRVPGCDHTWTWAADAQRRHASWLRREKAKIAESEAKQERSDQPEAASAPTTDANAPGPDAGTPATESAQLSEADPSSEQPASGAEPADAAAGSLTEAPASETETSEDDGAAAASAVSPDEASPAPSKKRKRRRRKNKRQQKKLQEGPPEKLCESCSEQIKKLEPLDQPCKVHGCKDTWKWDREHQLRAWVASGRKTGSAPGEQVTEAPRAQRRMCLSCRDFCRANKDRNVVCGKPECEKTWMYKTGAQLQDQLAGRSADPIKLCEDCMKEQFVAPGARTGALPEGSEVMPCAVSGCGGTWIYAPGMKLAPLQGDAPPADRMCDKCRIERELEPRGVVVAGPGLAHVHASSQPAGEGAPDSASEAVSEPVSEPASAPASEPASAPEITSAPEPVDTSASDES